MAMKSKPTGERLIEVLVEGLSPAGLAQVIVDLRSEVNGAWCVEDARVVHRLIARLGCKLNASCEAAEVEKLMAAAFKRLA